MEFIKLSINRLVKPSLVLPFLIAIFFFIFPINDFFDRWNRKLGLDKIWTKKGGAICFLTLTAGFLFGMTDHNFRTVMLRADNLPIVGLIYLAFFFLWLSLSQARINDLRMDANQKPLEWHDAQEKVLVWPDLVFIELIACVSLFVFLLLWSSLVPAPLEEPANPTTSPNPAKAPWYFLALQEMLVYFDPWLAGVILPSLIVVGLIAIPYIDRNHVDTGFYTFKRRRKAISIFLFGWLVLWLFTMVVGTILRGPNWNLFGLFEYWDPHKVVALTNINLSEYIYVLGFNRGLPQNLFVREIGGFLVLGFYFVVIPLLLTRFYFQNILKKMGFVRYSFFLMFVLCGVGLPLKMLLRWLFNLKYIISIPEFFLNI